MSNDSVQVLDIPLTATADEMAEMLNARCVDGTYLLAVVPWGSGARAVLRPRAVPYGEPGSKSAVSAPPRKLEAVAMDFIRDHREMPVPQLWAGLQAIGFKRSNKWISARRADVLRAARLKT